MTTEQKELLNRIKDEVAKENNFQSWKDVEVKYMGVLIHPLWSIICQRYADAVNKELQEEKDRLDAAEVEWFKENVKLREEIERLKVFKDYVHKRLDDAGIEKDPESVHKEAGCRIGVRLDIVLNGMCTKESRQKSIEASLEKAAYNFNLKPVTNVSGSITGTNINNRTINSRSNIVIIEHDAAKIKGLEQEIERLKKADVKKRADIKSRGELLDKVSKKI